jgi:DNA primase
MAIPQSFIQELLARADVVDIVGRYVQLKKTGANFSGLCPFHAEKSPSFTVSPSKQFFHCFGCGKNGNAIGFLMEHAGMGFIEAVKDLAGQYGMEVPEDDRSPQDRERAAKEREKQATLSDVLEKAGDAYRKHLKASPRAIAYLKGRGLTGEIAKRFGLGYAPEGWRTLASVFPKYDDPLLEESGLVIAGDEDKRYDRFRDRIMFPIRSVKGECIGFGGRVLGDEKPKYLNSPETPVFSKGRELYGLFEARNHLREFGYVLVTEGYMDVVALAQLGFPNAVATLGTACTPEHVHKLFRFTDSVVFSFDGDAAGRRAARKALEGALGYATDVRSIKFLFLPAEHDPDSFIRDFGSEAFATQVAQATPLSRFLIEAAAEGCDLLTAEGRAHMAANAKPLWMALPDGALKMQLLGDIASQVQLGTHELQTLWGLVAPRKTSREPRPRDRERRPDAPPRVRLPGRMAPAGRADHALRLVLGDSAAWDSLSHEDHEVLCSLPAPHGPLFRWLDSQVHEHGAQPWGSLREGLRGVEGEEAALRLMSAREVMTTEPAELESELRALLNGLIVERLKAQETEALAAAAADPSAQERYRALQARRRALETQLVPGRPAS